MSNKPINYEGIIKSQNEHYIMFISPAWRFDNFRRKIGKYARKGYYKIVTKRERRKGHAFGDYFERTDKKWEE